MHRILIGALPLLLLLPAALGQEAAKKTDKPDKKQTPAEEYRSLRKEFEDKRQAVLKVSQEAKTPEEKTKAFEKWPKPQDYVGRALNAAQKAPKEPFAVDALLWVAQLGQGSPAGNKALDMLVKDHIQSERLVEVCDVLSYSREVAAGKYLETIMEKTPHREAKGRACYALAHHLNGMADGRQGKKADEERKKAEQLLEEVVEKYGKLKYYSMTLAEAAKGDLFELRNLTIGKVAPEIEGEDIDGAKFKLSDYRGKVVVLDFWGNW
jgi:AhpC/TSA family